MAGRQIARGVVLPVQQPVSVHLGVLAGYHGRVPFGGVPCSDLPAAGHKLTPKQIRYNYKLYGMARKRKAKYKHTKGPQRKGQTESKGKRKTKIEGGEREKESEARGGRRKRWRVRERERERSE